MVKFEFIIKKEFIRIFKRFITSIERSNEGYSFERSNGNVEMLKINYLLVFFNKEEVAILDENNNNAPVVMVKYQEPRSIPALNNGEIVVNEKN